MIDTNFHLRHLPIVLQPIQAKNQTGSLVVQHQNTYAVLTFQQGQLKHAQIGLPDSELEGDEALYSLLTWEDGQLIWEEYVLEDKTTITPQQEQKFYQAITYLSAQGNFELKDSNLAPLTLAKTDLEPANPKAMPTTNQSRATIFQATTLPTPSAPPVAPEQTSVIATLTKMGVPYLTSTPQFSLNSHFANVLISARAVAGEQWHAVLEAAQLTQVLTQEPPDDEQYTTPVEYLSRLNYGFEKVFGATAPDTLKEWGRYATERSFAQRKGNNREQGIMKLVPGQQRKLSILLSSFTKSMNHVRGERLHVWKQVDDKQFWLVNYNNLYALGRLRNHPACQVWTASIAALIDWAGLANQWYVEEIECGCMTKTFNCVFAVRSRQ